MDIFRKPGKWLLVIFTGLIGLLLIYLLFAIILGLIPVNKDFKNDQNGTTVFVSSNGVHTNLILPSKSKYCNWSNELSFNNNYTYLAFGWGDKEFYMNTPEWSDLKLGIALKAILIPTSSVIQVYGLRQAPQISKKTKKIVLNTGQYKTLVTYIYNTFVTGHNAKPIELLPTMTGSGFYKYFEAKGKYTLFFTCNNWTSRGLKKAGVKNAVWAPFDKSVLYHLK